MNEGKKFELAFKNSVPDNVFYHRLPDPAEAFSSIRQGLRFTVKNPCDVFLFDPESRNMFAFELKSTKDTSMTYWREDFEDADKNQTFMVRKNQIQGLYKISRFNIVSGFVFNFRYTEHTYFQSIADFLNMTNNIDKKSFNEANVLQYNGVLIQQTLMRTNYRYNVKDLLDKIKI